MKFRQRKKDSRGKPPYRSPFLRAIGLDEINTLCAQLRSWGEAEEPKKRIDNDSRWVAFQRCGVHLLPSIMSIIIITLNLREYFIGFELQGKPGRTSQYMAALQIAAKVQELLIVASLATVVLHRLRYDLISGAGVPFGLVGAPSLFNQLNFFWSTSFIGSLSKRTGPSGIFLGLVLISGFIAATVGPAVAVLIIPREHSWPAGGTTYWVNGSSDDLWPARVGLEHYMPADDFGIYKASCTANNAYTNSLCPPGGYLAILRRLSQGHEWQARSGARDGGYDPMRILGSGSGTLVTSTPLRGQMKLYTLVSAQRNALAVESSALAVHGPTAWIAKELGQAWYNAAHSAPLRRPEASSRYRYYSTMKSVVNTSNPVVRVVCSPQRNLVRGQNELVFPWVPDFDPAVKLQDKLKWDSGVVRELRAFRIQDGSLHNRPFSSIPRVFRVDISGVEWTNSTTGLIIEYPWTSNRERNVTGCVLDTRWADGVVFYEYDSAPQPALHNSTYKEEDRYLNGDLFRLTPNFVRKRIDISKDLFDAVNFILPNELQGAIFDMPTLLRPPNISAIEALMLSIRWGNDWNTGGHITDIEHTIATLFADALARANTWRMSPENPYPRTVENWKTKILSNGEAYDPPPRGSPNLYTTFKMEQTITGYAYKVSGLTDKLALMVVFLHLGIATGHTLFLMITKRSSGCWDSLTELLSLAQQSTPSTTALKNTGTGIFKPRTFRQITRIRISNTDIKNVELAFDEDHVHDNGRIPDTSAKYG